MYRTMVETRIMLTILIVDTTNVIAETIMQVKIEGLDIAESAM